MEPLGTNDVDSYEHMMDSNGKSPMGDETVGRQILNTVMSIPNSSFQRNDMREAQQIENQFRKK